MSRTGITRGDIDFIGFMALSQLPDQGMLSGSPADDQYLQCSSLPVDFCLGNYETVLDYHTVPALAVYPVISSIFAPWYTTVKLQTSSGSMAFILVDEVPINSLAAL